MTDDEFMTLAYDGMFGAYTATEADEVEGEHRIRDTPAHTALFNRTFPTYTESMWIQGYPSIRCIVVTHPAVGKLPGVVQTIPIGHRDMASAEKFRARFERTVDLYVSHGWVRKPHTVSGS